MSERHRGQRHRFARLGAPRPPSLRSARASATSPHHAPSLRSAGGSSPSRSRPPGCLQARRRLTRSISAVNQTSRRVRLLVEGIADASRPEGTAGVAG